MGFASIKDIGEKRLFDGSDAERSIVYGKQWVTIDKYTGELGLFYLPEGDNLPYCIRPLMSQSPKRTESSCMGER